MARKSSSSGVIWQVLAPVIRWPLSSPRRLGSVLLAILAACLLLSLVNGRSSGQELSASAGTPVPAAATAAAPTTSVTSTGVEGLPGSTPSPPPVTQTGTDVEAPVSDRYVTVAQDFVQAYLAVRTTDPAAWQRRVRSLVSDALYPGMVAIDPNRVTTATLTAVRGMSPAADGGGIALATLSDNQVLDVTVSATPDGALVVVAFAPHT